MKKKQLIRIIQDKNDKEVEFYDNYTLLSKRLNLENDTTSYEVLKKHRYNSYSFFKYATLSLLVVTLFLSGLLINTMHKKQNHSEHTHLQLIQQYFIENEIKYLESPIKTEVINGSILNIYLGVTKDNEFIFVYTTKDRIDRGINISSYAIEGDGSYDVENTTLNISDSFTLTTNQIATNFTFEFSYKNEENNEEIYITTIEMSNYLEYFNKTGQNN